MAVSKNPPRQEGSTFCEDGLMTEIGRLKIYGTKGRKRRKHEKENRKEECECEEGDQEGG